MHPYVGKLKRWQKIALIFCGVDFLCTIAAYFLALYLRFDFVLANIDKPYYAIFSDTILYYALSVIPIYYLFRLYSCSWRFVGYNELARCIMACGLSWLLHLLVISSFYGRMPQSYYVFGGVMQMGLLVASRFCFRFFILVRSKYFHNHEIPCELAMLIGAGSSGHLVLRDLSTTNQRNIRFKCVIDDDPNKWGSYLEGVPVVGGREKILEMSRKYEIAKIFIAIPRATKEQRADILNICRETSCEVKLLPGVYQFAGDEVHLSDMQNVTVEDLLRDSSVTVDADGIREYFKGKVVLVTGGGGSIGMELCRQIASYAPKSIVAFDHFENRVSGLQQELLAKYPGIAFVIQIGSVQDPSRIAQVVQTYRPQVVFHAAGFKHVGLMEDNPSEAIKNNVLGTYWTARAAQQAGTELFVYLSTDKAVNPTSILGAASRINEMLLQVLSQNGPIPELDTLKPGISENGAFRESRAITTRFASIRFGNAFGSDGSAFELFQQQIAEGGPVKVRHKDIRRFCMTIPDVVRLLLQTCALQRKEMTYVLDMGTPYSIDELARTIIKLKGFVPDKEIRIEYTGLLPGEKLCDEPLMWEEGMSRTSHPQIIIANRIKFHQEYFVENLLRLIVAAKENKPELNELIAQVVHSYHVVDNASPDAIHLQKATLQPKINLLEQVAMQFDMPGEVRAVIPMSSGYINRTYKVETVDKNGIRRTFTLQRINTEVFKSPKRLMENYSKVTRCLSQNLKISPRHGELSNPMVMPTRNGALFHSDDSGCWRMLTYFRDVHSYDVVESPEVFYQAGRTFGAFLKAISSLSPVDIHEVIPDFHNTPRRYARLEEAIAGDSVGRVKECGAEIEFVRSHSSLFGVIAKALEAGEIPLRIGHNDCNLNNILFDNASNLPVAVIDLDTVMPSTPLYDFGDAIRSGANTACDDERDLSKVACSLELYEKYARGWLETCGDMLTKRELELLPYASLVITSEDGIRFLADHLQGDIYYHTSYHGQNLDRARTQFRLLEDMERKLPVFQSIIGDICRELQLREVAI